MRYLRMLSNSVIAGGLASGYLTALVLQLNPSLPIDAATLAPLALILGFAYGANLTAVFYALIVLRQILAVEVLSPGWLSVRLLSWLGTIAAGAAAALMWMNLRGFGPVLDADTRGHMTIGAGIVSAAAAVFLSIGLAHLGRRGGRLSASLLSATMVVSVVAPIVARGPAQPLPLPARPTAPVAELGSTPSQARLTLLMFDGASLDIISPAVAAGRLPNIGRIFDQGAVLHLATLRPTQAEPVWSAIATGRLPMNNGVRAAVVYRMPGGAPIRLLPDYCFAQALVRFGFLTPQTQTAADLAARPIWGILSDHSVRVGVIGWPLTNPAPAVNGFLVSDRFHEMSETELDLDGATAVYPPELLADARAALATPADARSGGARLHDGRAPAGQRLRRPARSRARRRRSRAPAVDERARTIAVAPVPRRAVPGRRCGGAPLPAVRRSVGLRRRVRRRAPPVRPRAGRVPRLRRHARRARAGPAGPRRRAARRVGLRHGAAQPGQARPGDAGRQPADLAAPTSARPTASCSRSASRWRPDVPGRTSVVDITPTILYFLGLPVARDMEGFPRTDIFKPSFTGERPVTYIPSYGR